ncbi:MULTISPECIES: MFS transporter TsgA [Francisella]|uniref:MFS transporter TsgA n=1 Tax=Francisella opportunistica TaxID=2016517 RepID=A0A345JQ90_9GAMM|nr:MULTISPECIES: MFS transporter TsgA [Francisella]APC91184.1 TsgA-like protein [Francisella sp. MA067296]AXH29486.1 MFS transporter TsgA [Francisella opportunistica]AXH31137.1 MFS transporter TsgA [Francisella opportunistica]AXH32782.1 MFS transporter TsgA [Francisella opportunistica]
MEITIYNSPSLKNKLLITFICYFCYFYTANVVLVTGAVMQPLSEYFHNSNIGFAFTFINVAMWFAILVIGILMNRFSIKLLLIAAVVIGIIPSLITSIIPSMFTLKILLTGVGITGGLFMAIASYMIVHIYNDHKIRAMNVIFTDFFFSFGGALIPIFAAYLITQSFEWYTIYLILQITAVIILVLVIFSDFTILNRHNNVKEIRPNLNFSSWNLSLYCVAFAAFLFLLAQLTMTSYAQSYFQEILGWGTIDANKPLSYFWTAQCVGLFISPLITRFIPLRYILPTFMLVGLVALSCILYIPNIDTVFKAAIIFGLFNCYIYAGLLAYGTFQMENAPPTLITTILLFGTTGTALSTTTGAFINQYFGLTSVIHAVVIFYIISFLLVILAVIFSKEQKNA